MSLRTSIIAAAGLAATMSACSTDPLDEPQWAGTWATNGSAVAVYSVVYDPFGREDGHVTFPDATCPTVGDDGTTLTITGGCTDSRGDEWRGTATIVRGTDGTRTLTMTGYGRIGDPNLASTATGRFALRTTGTDAYSFDTSFVREGGLKTTVNYVGSVAGNYTRSTWNGSGTVERDGFSDPTGDVRVMTVDEVVDDAVCSGQPVSGTTTVTSDDHIAVITYDGATACDAAKAARLTYDGADRGLIEGINCAVTAPGSGYGRAPFIAFAGLALYGLARATMRRRRRRQPLA